MGVRGFRPSGRVPFAAMQKEPKNRWGTARGTSGFALRPNGLTPGPRYGVPRPCVGRTLQKLIRRTLPVQLRNSGRFTGDTLYPHHDNPQNLFPLRLTAVARRSRPMRAAAESGGAQRGGAARASTTAHNWESQARKDSGGHVLFSDRSGPGRPGRRGSDVRACAPDARHTPSIELPLGPGPQARGTLATFLPWKVARPQAKYPHPPSRPQAK